MPYNVQLPNGTLIEGIPDDVSKEQARKMILEKFPELAPKTGVKDYLKDIPKALGRGAAGLLETSAIGASALLPEEYEKQARAGIESLARPAQEYLAPATPELGESISSKLAAGVGSTLPFFVAGPLGVAGRLGAGALGAAAGAGEARQEAERAGATAEERSKATLLGAPVGMLDILAPNIGPLKGLLTTALARGGMEGLTEAAQKVAQNYIAQGIYDPKRDVLEGSAEEGAYGAGVGALTSLLVDLALGRRAKGAPAPQPSPAPPVGGVQPQVPEAPPVSGKALPQKPGAPAFMPGYQEAEQLEQMRQQAIEQGKLDEAARIEAAMIARQERVAKMPGFGEPSGNVATMQAIDERRMAQAKMAREEAAAAEKARLAEIAKIEQTTYSPDPVQDQLIKRRLLSELVPQQVATLPLATPESEPAGLFPKGEPLEKEPQGKPRGVQKFEFTPEEQAEIKSLKDSIAAINKDISATKAQKTSLFKTLEGALTLRPGSFNLADIDKDKASLRRLYNKEGKGVLLEDLVEDGSLDNFLPAGNRKIVAGQENPRFDSQAAIEHIAGKLRSGDYASEIEAQNLQALEQQRDAAKAELEKLESMPAVNRELAAQTQMKRTGPSLQDLLDDAANSGVDVERVQEDVARQMPNATDSEYRLALYKNLMARADRGPIVENLYQQSGKKFTGYNPTAEGTRIQKELEGKSFDQLVQWNINNAPNRFQKLVAQKVKAMVEALRREGVQFHFDLQGGNQRNARLRGAEGVTSFVWDKDKTDIYVQLNGEPVIENQAGYPSGMSYGTIAHELLHVATRSATRFLPPNHPLIKDLRGLFNTVVDQFNKDAKAGKLPEILQKFYERRNNVLESPDEMITWGLTDRDFQDYLSNINVGPKQTAFSKFVELIREMLGLAKPFETAMEKLVRTTESILEIDVNEVKAGMVQYNVAFGKAPKPTTEMQQQTLLKSNRLLRDDLSVRREGFFFDAKQSPLYQTRTADEAKPVGEKEAMDAIMSTKVGKDVMGRNNKIKDGDYVGVRLDLNILRATGVPVQSVHQGKEALLEKGAGFYSGEILKYAPHATLRNVHFKIQQTRRENIATGKEQKSKMGSADGQWVDTAPNYDGIELRFNPRREHLFRDALGRAVKYADEITTTGNKMFARGRIEYYGEEDVPARAGTAPTEARLMRPGEMAAGVKIDQPGNKVSIPQQESLFMRNEAITDDLAKREDGFYIRAEDSPLYQKRDASQVVHPSMQVAEQAVMATAKGRRIEEKGVDLEPGQYIGARLDLAILSSTGVPVQALHEGKASTHEHGAGYYGGDVLKYAPYVTMRNVFFKINQPYREKIASGIKKKPMGSADGQFVRIDNPNFDGVELRFNPRREHLFVDAMGRAVKYAEEITTTGNSVFARGYIEYYGEEDFVHPAGASPTRAVPMKVEVMQSIRQTGAVSAPIQESLFMRNDMPSVEQISVGEEELYPTRDEKVQIYLNTHPNAKRHDMVMFDDAIFFKQSDGRYTDDPLGRDDRTDMEFSSVFDIKNALKQDYPGVKLEDLLMKPLQFNRAKNAAKTVANEPAITETLAKAAAIPQRTQLGSDALEMLSGIGRSVAEPEPGYVQKVRQSWDNARDNPKATREAAYGAFRRFADQVETWSFSSDAALNNQIRREVMSSMVGNEQKIGTLLNTSLSQTAHSDAIANLFLMEGNIRYNTEINKWEGVKDDNNIFNLSKKLDEIAQKNGLTKEEIELISHTAFEARRTQGLIDFNANIDAQVEAIRAEAAATRAAGKPVAAHALSERAQTLLTKKKVTKNMSPEEIATGMKFFDMFPGLNEVTSIWNGMRENALKVMVDTGLYTEEEANMLLDVVDYVPFYREDQIEGGKGPKEFLRSLSVQADRRLKGSAKPVNDIFDNMVRWTQYAINRGVRNRSAVALAETAEQVGLADRVEDAKAGDNVVSVWKDGQRTYYNMQDPLFMSAFRGLESVAIPTVKVFSKMADVLRQSVVLYPLFSVAQVPQDSFAAMFTSGLKPQHALTIPVRAVKEFIQTLRGKSKAHEELKNVGAVGVRDFTSAVIRADAEIFAGLKKDKSLWEGVKRKLGNLAMAADNAVRQATYEAALAQGLSKAEAIEKAFEIFNVRRRGNSQMLALAGQVIPFFNAYLAAQHVAYRTLTGVGTSPTERKAAFQTLAATTGSVMALSVLYAMMNGDDDDYLSKPTPTRDRLLMIPGTGGFSIPLRADIFALPKVLAEHTYLLLTDNGYEDGAKMRASMASLLANSIFSPTPVPQAIKPIVEAAINYDFFQQKPLVGVFQQKKELGRQFEDSTSEFSKLLGKTGFVSPIVADHLVRGMFGSFGGLFLYATNPILAEMSGTPRPSLSFQDALATIPNASGFVSREYETALRKDFYALKEVTDRASATMSDLKTRSPQEIADYLSDEKNRARVALAPGVNQIATKLTNIRKAVTTISQATEDQMNEEEKQRQIKQLREAEEQTLKGVNLKRLRELAQL